MPARGAQSNAHGSDHVVTFSATDEELIGSLGPFVTDALLGGAVAILVDTDAHRTLFERSIASVGLDVVALHASGRLVVLDAAATVARLLVDGRPDRAAFDEIVGAMMRRLVAGGHRVVAYGEMVGLLWQDGHVLAALELEAL